MTQIKTCHTCRNCIMTSEGFNGEHHFQLWECIVYSRPVDLDKVDVDVNYHCPNYQEEY